VPGPIGGPNNQGPTNRVGGFTDIPDWDSMSIDEKVFAVMSKRTDELQKQMTSALDMMMNRNKLIEQNTKMLQEARNHIGKLKDGESATMSQELAQFCKDNGINLPGRDSGVGFTGLTAQQKQEKLGKFGIILDAINNKGYTDKACVRADLSPKAIAAAKELGIEVKGDGMKWNSNDWDAFASAVNTKKIQLENTPLGGKPVSTPASQGTFNKNEWASIVENLKGFTETKNTDAQMDMISYQKLTSQFTTATEMLSNTLKKLGDNMAAIVRNI